MSIDDVMSRIDAVTARVSEIQQYSQRVSPGITIAASAPAGQPTFAQTLSTAGSAPISPSQLAGINGGTGVVSGPVQGATVSAATFAAASRPATLSSARALAQGSALAPVTATVTAPDAAVESPTLPTNANGALSDAQLRDVLAQAGFTGDSLRTAWALARRESGGRPAAESAPNSNGTVDHGLFQINDVHRGSWIDFSRLDDPLYSAQVAYRMSDKGTNFSAWALGTTGWAGHLQQTAPDTYASLQSKFLEQYAKYPF